MNDFDRLHPTGQVKKSSKDYGKVFICRRGCNTRTTTYTPEFVWSEVYKGADDIDALVQLVESQTKATRRGAGAGRPKKPHQGLDEFVVPDSDDDGIPKTPRKRRKLNDATTPTSTRKSPASRKFLTPTHKRIVIKKQLEFTPLGTRVLSPSALNSPFQIARNQLHVSSVPAALPCREEEFSTVYSHLEAAITEGSGSCIYISGTPGTGKTATVREVVAQLHASVQAEELDDFIFVEINGMKVTDPHQSYSLLWQALRGDRVSPSHALELLEREFSTPSPRRVPCVVLMDELDQLVTKNQSVMYNFFNWPGLRHSRLIVLAVANTMDLPERTLSNKISSRLGTYRHPTSLATPLLCRNMLSISTIVISTRPKPYRARMPLNDLLVEIVLSSRDPAVRICSGTFMARLTSDTSRFDAHHLSGLYPRPIDANYPIPP
jgi:origin recognition complex subunit 1